ncbi:MAG TPA: DUF4399 domain-containing protein [Amaricoccus sp.]|uniref:DUF4399 domain-containing protein n=1 Tax=Amaricoccus sp. TaxID=1872485 RepID=UPI002D1BC499|nr:DUF4399 domain-containing protein [Amaricoccus sp.]HMQ92257.1 DUF4399 domain-containing protein [Amaricoccus sp.]HMR51998.1 DUF4399 domain-containing protein [Amaricoccus sp.]HMR59885.1 DUF4399 domain-containing protein [Amaricoccus sp.]HMT98800.1 DUF4399 domain-containing protein [Amaricoccus sp.]
MTIPALLLAAFAGPALAERMAAPEGAAAYIIAPADGATVTSPVTVVFGLRGMGVAPAGVEQEGTGHHHLLIDIEPEALDLDAALPADDHVRHFGGGQTETSLELAPGAHTLRLLLGDMNHVPFDPPVVSEEITVTVE